ncbi:MAG: arylsulfatase, partial [Candidatus Cryptobacteroides sp.]
MAAEKKNPNLIFILVDDMGYGDMSCHGNPVFETKNLDAFHNQSVRFTQFHVAPMSTPTRGQLMSGREALVNGASWVGTTACHLRTDIPILPEILGEAGYSTAIFGKWHLGDNYPLRPQDRGFDYTLTFPQQEVGTVNDYWYNDYFDDVYIENGVQKQFDGFCTDVWFREATKWIDGQKDQDRPFFCYIPTNVTHGPFFSPEEYQKIAREHCPQISAFHQSYVATMLNLDDNIGNFMSYLEKSGLLENTIVFFMTDNGATGGYGMYNAGMRGLKANLWEGGHRVPWFVMVPGNEPKEIGGLAQAEDVLPTIMELCGIKAPEDYEFDGISLAGQIVSDEEMPDRILVNQFQRRKEIKKYDACVMWGPWRLINGLDSSPEDNKERKAMYDKRKKEYQINFELYNIEKDPHQDENVIEQYPEIAKKLKDFYENWWEEVSPEMFKRGQIIIGDDAENPMMLCCTSWKDQYVSQKKNVLDGKKVKGTWNVYAEVAGTYRFRLYRWPIETNAPIRSAINMYYRDATPLGEFTEGKFLDIKK